MPDLKSSPVLAFVAALLVTLLVTPGVRALALRGGAVAKPDARRIHEGHIAQWGGIALFAGVAVAALLWRQPTFGDLRQLAASGSTGDIEQAQRLHLTTAFFGCGGLMLLLGALDDRFELPPLPKFGGQLAIVGLMWLGGVRINSLPFSSGTHALAVWESFGLTVLWTLGLVNGINFIDGVDGLASGVCAIAAGCLCLIEVEKGAVWAAAASAAVCGASVGFLRYNFPPAKIFLGDAGSLLLGFWLAFVAVAAASKTAAATTLALPMLVLGVPLFDTLWAIGRRTLAGQPMWRADRGHLHHRLLARGFSPIKTTLVIYGIALTLGALAIVWARVKG